MQGSERPLKSFSLSCIAFTAAGREVSSVMRVNAHDCSFCGGFRVCGRWGFRLCGGEAVDGARLAAFRSPPPPLRAPTISLHRTNRWQVTAALSAAVTTAKQQGIAPTLHGRTSRKKRTSLFPATLRERGSGGEALLLEKRPLPQNLPTPYSFFRRCAVE